MPLCRYEVAVSAGDHLGYLVIVRQRQFEHNDVFFKLRRDFAKRRRQYADGINGAVLFKDCRQVPELTQKLMGVEVACDVFKEEEVIDVLAL